MCLPEPPPRDAALAQLAGLDPAVLDAAGLMTQITDLATFISQAQGHLARLTGALDATGDAAEAGHKSASAFLRTRCGLSPGHAAAVTTIARGLRGLEATRKALETGVISFDQAQIIIRTATDLDDADAAALAERVLLDHAPRLTPPGSASSRPRLPTGLTLVLPMSGRSGAGSGGTCRSG